MNKAYIIIALIILSGTIISGVVISMPVEHPFELDAFHHNGKVSITFVDRSEQTQTVTMEILGMKETFRQTYNDNSFIKEVQITEPQYGWVVHPIVLEITHKELGDVQLKTEIYSSGETPPPLIYGPR